MNECLTTPFVVIHVFKYKDQFKDVSYLAGVRCSFVVRTFARGAMGRRIDPLWWTH